MVPSDGGSGSADRGSADDDGNGLAGGVGLEGGDALGAVAGGGGQFDLVGGGALDDGQVGGNGAAFSFLGENDFSSDWHLHFLLEKILFKTSVTQWGGHSCLPAPQGFGTQTGMPACGRQVCATDICQAETWLWRFS